MDSEKQLIHPIPVEHANCRCFVVFVFKTDRFGVEMVNPSERPNPN